MRTMCKNQKKDRRTKALAWPQTNRVISIMTPALSGFGSSKPKLGDREILHRHCNDLFLGEEVSA
jgi:hypothetical protein